MDLNVKNCYEPINILIYDRKNNTVHNEISLIAFDKVSSKVLAVGNDALSFSNSTDDNIIVHCPLKNGVIADYNIAQKMFQGMLQKLSAFKSIFKPKIALCVNDDITEVELKAFQEAFYQSGTKEMSICNKPYYEINKALPKSYSFIVDVVRNENENSTINEVWKEEFKNKIPLGIYNTTSINTDNNSTLINLSSETYDIKINFNKVIAIRMFEKEFIPYDIYLYKDNFKNVIYSIQEGEFNSFINKNSYEKTKAIKSKHYIIISNNYFIEVISENEPYVSVSSTYDEY